MQEVLKEPFLVGGAYEEVLAIPEVVVLHRGAHGQLSCALRAEDHTLGEKSDELSSTPGFTRRVLYHSPLRQDLAGELMVTWPGPAQHPLSIIATGRTYGWWDELVAYRATATMPATTIAAMVICPAVSNGRFKDHDDLVLRRCF
ncbi:MAG TPA: hypothetical protein PLC05_00025 [bacterium]|nr:hypothetical protein [bacterium]HOR57769.1 hypothetical protein [bacterium]HPL55880.1 hypothetical protein [bacterium]